MPSDLSALNPNLEVLEALAAASLHEPADRHVLMCAADHATGLPFLFAQLPPPSTLPADQRTRIEQAWDTLVDRCSETMVLQLFRTLDKFARADLVVRALEGGKGRIDPTWIAEMRRSVDDYHLFVQAGRRGSTEGLRRLLVERGHGPGLRNAFVEALENGREAVAQVLWPPLLEQGALSVLHVTEALRQPSPDWFNRMRPHLDLAGWERVIEEVLLQPCRNQAHKPAFVSDPSQAQQVLAIATDQIITQGKKWDKWADALIDRAVRERGMFLDVFVERLTKGLWLPRAMAAILEMERWDLVPALAGHLDFDQLRDAWITHANPPKWEAWDRLGCWVEPALAEAWYQRDAEKMPKTFARLRAERARQAVSDRPVRSRVRH